MTDEYRVDRLLNGDLSALTTLASSTSTLKSDGAYHQQRGLKPPRVPLVFFEDCGREIVKPSLIKGVFATGETSTWIGPPRLGQVGAAGDRPHIDRCRSRLVRLRHQEELRRHLLRP
jgi:hypothetical protein